MNQETNIQNGGGIAARGGSVAAQAGMALALQLQAFGEGLLESVAEVFDQQKDWRGRELVLEIRDTLSVELKAPSPDPQQGHHVFLRGARSVADDAVELDRLIDGMIGEARWAYDLAYKENNSWDMSHATGRADALTELKWAIRFALRFTICGIVRKNAR